MSVGAMFEFNRFYDKMKDPPLLVEVRNCLFPIVAISTVYRQNVLPGSMSTCLKNITSYLGKCRFSVCGCVCVPTCVWADGGAVKRPYLRVCVCARLAALPCMCRCLCVDVCVCVCVKCVRMCMRFRVCS
jgi:hypothetical protein